VCVLDDAFQAAGLAAQVGLRGLLLVPSILSWPHVQVTIDPGRQPALVYPPLAAASAWGTPPAKPGRALRALLGTTRARVLLALSQPRSTTEIARTLSLSPASASHHLRVLKEAGLVGGRRQGRWVLYGLTTKAEKLIDVSL
jgi:DNA-binding transcriptional ArsR family regulator